MIYIFPLRGACHETQNSTFIVHTIMYHPYTALADFESGMKALLAEDFATALDEWRPLANEGNADAQYELGKMNFYGQGTPPAPIRPIAINCAAPA